MLTTFIRTLIMYFSLIVAVRLTGKRQIGELQVSELVVTFMLSELAVLPITDKSLPLSFAVIPIVLLLSLEVIISFIQTKSIAFRKFFSGGPTVLIEKGKLKAEELAKNRIDLEELLGELRQKGAFNISDVEYAFLEENGKLSVLPKAESAPLTPAQLAFPVVEAGCSHAVIVDGKINDTALSSANMTAKHAEKLLSSEKLTVADVFLMTADDAGNVFIVVKQSPTSCEVARQISIPKKCGGKRE